MTKYYDATHRYRPTEDSPISVRNYEHDQPKTYYCNYCQRNLVKLIDSSHQNVSYYCQNCSMEVDPSLTELRSASKLSTPDGPPDHPYASTKFVEPDLRKKKTEIKGGLAELHKRGIKITSYTESNTRRRKDND